MMKRVLTPDLAAFRNVVRDTPLPFRKGRASGPHQRGGLFPKEPRLERVVEPLTYLDNRSLSRPGARLPDYSFSWF